MRDYLNEINSHFPVRRSDAEKLRFAEYVKEQIGEGRVKVEQLEKQHNNIIIGDLHKAKVVFTAHYDTPAASVVPNMMLPANKILAVLVNCIYPVLLSLVCLFAALVLWAIIPVVPYEATAIIYAVLYLGVYYCTTRLLPNKNNKNDNTSGVATVLSLAEKINAEDIAFVLFDNEEKGLQGSKALNKKYKEEFASKLVINLDCVGNGDQIIFAVKERAQEREEYKTLVEQIDKTAGFDLHFIPFNKTASNSDHKSFPCSIGIMATKRGKIAKFYTDRIHTSKDTVALSENIYFLTEQLKKITEKRQS